MQLIAYTMVSGLAFVVDALVLLVAAQMWSVPASASAAAGFLVGLIVNFVLCRQLVFPDARGVGFSTQFGGFVLSGMGGLLVTVVLVEALVTRLAWPLLIAKFSAAGVVVVLNFYFRSTFVFKRA